MKSIELTLLILTYTVLVITIFVSIICYKRNIEKWETIALEVSFLLLVLSMTIEAFTLSQTKTVTANIFVLLSMIAVGLATPLSVMSERKHNIPAYYMRLLVIVGGVLFLATCVMYFIYDLNIMEYIITVFLGSTVIFSMLVIRNTQPQKSMAHQEKATRIFAIAFMILVPASLVANYTLEHMGIKLTIGLTIPIVFILLSANKLLDDLKRLSLVNPNIEPNQQHFENYLLTEREREIATLLIKGKTYVEISELLFISLPTVKTHSSKIYKKCNVQNRNELSHLLMN